MSTQTEVVLITGANQGLGYLTALQLSKLPGYHVLVGSRDVRKGEDAVKQIEDAGAVSPVSLVVIDVSSDESIDAASKDVGRRFGKLDVLVNNAGTAFSGLSTRELILKTLDTNVAGLAVTTEKFTPLLEKAKFPRVVNLSSPLGSLTWTSDPSHPASRMRNIAYNTSKTAVNAVTVHFASELKVRLPNVRVLALDPGYNATAINDFKGTQDPAIGAAGILRAIVEPENGEFKNGEFRNQFGEVNPW